MPSLGPYELLERLGAGGMAETFLALRRGDGGFEHKVCLKRVLPHLGADTELLRLFRQEAQLSARLRHANVAQVLDFGEHEGTHFLVLELVRGLDLRRLMRATNEPFSTGLIAFIAMELARGLEYAHSEGVVHRDISPSNILMSDAGEVKLADFGIAKAMGMTSFTRTGAVKGKVPYMAPEYARRGEYDARSDIFSLGVTLYELVAGRRPFDGKSDPETLENITKGQRQPLAELADDVHPELATIIERCVATKPEKRFADAHTLRHALAGLKPPATARRALSKRVKAAMAAGARVDAAVAQTSLAERTLAVGEQADAGPAVVPAAADAVTRTSSVEAPKTQVVGPPVMEPATSLDTPKAPTPHLLIGLAIGFALGLVLVAYLILS